MTEPVVVGLISAAALVLVAIIGLVGRVSFQVTRVRRDTAVTREQVANDHSTNLREEQDSRHTENARRLDDLAEKMDEGFEAMTQEFRALWGKAGSNADRIALLERTGPRPDFAPSPPPSRSGRHRKDTP